MKYDARTYLLQRALNTDDVVALTCDGVEGPKTFAALMDWRGRSSREGLPAFRG